MTALSTVVSTLPTFRLPSVRFAVPLPRERSGRRRSPINVWLGHAYNYGLRWADGSHSHEWGFGLLQVGSRHLFYVGSAGVSVLFIGKTL